MTNESPMPILSKNHSIGKKAAAINKLLKKFPLRLNKSFVKYCRDPTNPSAEAYCIECTLNLYCITAFRSV